jgi:hypothetical protein
MLLIAILLVANSGCAGGWFRRHDALGGGPQTMENPLFVPAMDREFLWNQTVDAVDDYFRIEREERVRLIGGVLTEGRIDTFPLSGSTILEPWRRDSTRGYEKWHATFQSIRRRAGVRVIPTEGGYLLDVIVQKELEDLDKPEHATAGGATLRYDGTLVRQQGAPGRFSVTLGWIPIGRDQSLEQRILGDISERLDIGGFLGHLPPVVEEMPMVEELPAIPGEPETIDSNRLEFAPPENLDVPLERLPPQLSPFAPRKGVRSRSERRQSRANCHLGRLPRDRQLDRELCPLADGAFDANAAVVRFNDLAASGQAQPRAPFARFIGAGFRRVERLEDPRELVGWNAATAVADDQIDRVGRRIVLQANQHAAAAGRRLPRVDEQVEQHLLNLIADRAHVGHVD